MKPEPHLIRPPKPSGFPPPLRVTMPLILLGLGLLGFFLQMIITHRVVHKEMQKSQLHYSTVQVKRLVSELQPLIQSHKDEKAIQHKLEHLVRDHSLAGISILDEQAKVLYSTELPRGTVYLAEQQASRQFTEILHGKMKGHSVAEDTSTLKIYERLEDLKPAAMLAVTADNTLSLQIAKKVTGQFALGYIFVSLLLGMLAISVLRNFVTNRVCTILERTESLTKSGGEKATAAQLQGRDEFAQIDAGLLHASELISQNEAQQEKLAHEIAEVAESEKRRIGQDLHDDICQRLAAVKISMQDMEEKLADKAPSLVKYADKIVERLDEAIQTTRTLARGLTPVEIDSGGLVIGLEALSKNSQNLYKIDCKVNATTDVPEPNTKVSTQIYRIAQECINNAARHGKATEINIHLEKQDDFLRITIANNGSTFDPHTPSQHKGMGLQIMRHRAASIGAELSFQTASTSPPVAVHCMVPLATTHLTTTQTT